jgi:hypothetical protein
MNEYNNKFNKDDVFIRNMIVCFLSELNKKIYYYNRVDNDKVNKINVPCMYSITGQERFLKDEFFYDPINLGMAIGDYEKVPRVIANLTGLTINTAEQTNKYNHTKIVRESNGKMRTCYLNVEWVPVQLSFDCNLVCSNNIELFKITECIISKIYKNPNYFKVDLGMCNVDGAFEVPENYSNEIPTEFGLNEKKEFRMNFGVEMKSFIPAFEHGLLLCEIDEMLSKIPKENEGIVMFRADDYGNMGLRTGGVLESFRVSEYAFKIEPATLQSNTHKVPMQAFTKEDLDKKDITEDLVVRFCTTPDEKELS